MDNNNWSIEAIKERAANNWSLEGDNQLLNLMKSISKNVEQRCMTSNSNLNRLMLDVDKTKIKLGNATTKLLDLNNAKFVEHTVMDMDSSLANMEKCTTTDSEIKTSVPLTKAVEEAVTNGLNMMDRCYEKVLLDLEDSDEEENENGQKQVVCRPRNPYLTRPLPHLIGSKLWNDKWHIGLFESDEEVLSDEEPEEFSQSSSEEADSISISPQTSNRPTTSESDFAAPTSTVAARRDDLFHRLSDDVEEKSPPEQREKIKVLPTIVPTTQKNDPQIESTNKAKQLTEPSVPSTTEQPKQTIFVQPKSEQKFLNLFDDEPPSLDEPIRSERKPVNLFLDSDDDDDLLPTNMKKPSSIFNNNVSNPQTLPFAIPQLDNAPKQDKSKTAFPGDVRNNNVPVVAKSDIKPTLKSNDFGGLFDDDEPPDDFFDIIVREKGAKNVDTKTIEKPKLQTKTVNLFDDDDDDDDFSKIIGTTKGSDSKVAAVKQIERTDVSYSPYNSPFKTLQNTGPPKSYVSFLDDESPSFDDDLDEEYKPITSLPPPVTDSGKTLFDDIEPYDEIVPSPAANRKPSTKIIYDDIAETLKEKTAPPCLPPPIVSSQNLFNEAPPDDEMVPPVALPRKSLPQVIDDTIVDSSESKTLLSEETPLPAKKETKSDDGHTQDETDQALTFKKNLSLFSNPEVAKLPTVEKESKPKPNKLKTNFNINVAALLPGAKLPSQKQLATVKQDRIDEPEPETIENVGIDRTAPMGNASRTSSTNVEDTSGRLICLSKNRAKIQVQRRPSTRLGRQNLYNKALVAENEDVVSSIETTDSCSSEANMQEQVIDIAENILKTDDEEPNRTTTTTVHPPPLESNNSNVDDEEEEDWLKTIDEQPSSLNKTNLYEEDEDWLSSKAVATEQKPSTQSLSHVMNYDWLTASSLPPEDINPPTNYPIDDEHEHDDDWLSSYVSKEKATVVADLPNDADDWLNTNEIQEQPHDSVLNDVSAKQEVEEKEQNWLLKTTLQSETNNNVKAEVDIDDWFKSSLAEASTSGTDDIPVLDVVNHSPTDLGYGGKRSNTFESNAETKSTPILFDSDDDDVLNHSRSKLQFGGESIFESSKPLRSSTLFDDDDDDVGTTKPPFIHVVPDVPKQSPPKLDFGDESSDTFQSTETKKLQKSKIFDDDDDDDDDLFASISKNKSVAKKTISNTTETVKTTKNVSNRSTGKKSLFSDDDNSDADDLFGSTKSTKKKKEKIETASKRKVDESIKAIGLFGDEDDDDEDIFTPKTQKQRVVPADPKKKPSITKSVATIPASNDPLADLLK